MKSKTEIPINNHMRRCLCGDILIAYDCVKYKGETIKYYKCYSCRKKFTTVNDQNLKEVDE